MTARAEVEEILEQRLWAERNGVDLGAAYVPPAQALRDHELKTYRDCPMEYEEQPRRYRRLGLWLIASLLVALLGFVAAYHR